MRLDETFEIHDNLDNKIFDNSGHMLKEVRDKIIQIVAYFEKYIEVPIYVCDVQLVGSRASFNYNKNSDMDIHIITCFDSPKANPEVLKALYDAKKSEFNQKHDIKIKGINVELFVQDVNSNTVTNGIYSVCDDCWVKEPKPMKHATKHNTEKEMEKWEPIIKEAIASNDEKMIQQTLNTLYLIRHNSIAIDGENGKGNQLFKDIRNSGLLDRLKDAQYIAASKELSLEGMEKGQIVSRLDD